MVSTALPSHSVTPGESPPSVPGTCFGRDELIKKVVDLAENIIPIALIGAGGIGKTSIALTVLHHPRIKQRFGDNRRFIRCDQFTASRTHFLNRLSEVIGAGIGNPETLTPLRPFFSSREMILVLDNAESILDPQGMNAREIYRVVEELSQIETLCLCITSRISTVPRLCKRPAIPTLSMESACDIFYRICDQGSRSDIISNLLRKLDFHALSVTLLATTASHNVWDYDRLAREWEIRRVQVLRTDYDESLAATIELSLASPTFRELGPDARGLLGVVAFFPQGIDESNLDWLFPVIANRSNIFDKFGILSLTHRSNGFITMLAPLRDYFCPEDPALSPLLCATKDRYFTRLSVSFDLTKPSFEEARWIRSEDANVEHLLDVFTTLDADSEAVWEACLHFMEHLFWHKRRLVALGQKIEGLPDDHRSKPECMFWLSQLYYTAGALTECKRLLLHTLRLHRERGSEREVARILGFLSDANRLLGHNEEGIKQVTEASEILDRLDDEPGRAWSWLSLAALLHADNQLDAAETAVSRAINYFQDEDDHHQVHYCHSVLGDIHRSKGETEEAIDHYETALKIASTYNWQDAQSSNHYDLGVLFRNQGRFDDAHAHLEQAKSHTTSDAEYVGHAMELQAEMWCSERKFQEARSEVLQAIALYERIGVTTDVERCRAILQNIEQGMRTPIAAVESGSGGPGKALKTVLLSTPANPLFAARGTRHRLAGIFRRILPRNTGSAFGRTPNS